MQLIIATPKGSLEPIECDSVHLNISEDANGKNGGSYGIRKGHVNALFSLEKGNITALLSGKTIFSATTTNGFATVNNDVVTVVVEEFSE